MGETERVRYFKLNWRNAKLHTTWRHCKWGVTFYLSVFFRKFQPFLNIVLAHCHPKTPRKVHKSVLTKPVKSFVLLSVPVCLWNYSFWTYAGYESNSICHVGRLSNKHEVDDWIRVDHKVTPCSIVHKFWFRCGFDGETSWNVKVT